MFAWLCITGASVREYISFSFERKFIFLIKAFFKSKHGRDKSPNRSVDTITKPIGDSSYKG